MQRNIIWKSIDGDTEENCAIHYRDNGITARSEISGWMHKQPLTVEYVVKLTMDWQVFDFSLTAQWGARAPQCYAMRRDSSGNWSGLSGVEYPEYSGCDYIDISLTPFTNSLPINGLKLNEGESRTIDVVYIDVLNNDLRRDEQRYSKLNRLRYRFENNSNYGDPFVAEIDVDENDFVTYYPELFETI